jgi:hypothetical protein
MGPQQSAVKNDLHGVASKADADGDADVAVADPIAGSAKLTEPWLSTMRRTSVPLVG